MINDYKSKIEVQKEVLSSLPRNNNKNEKLYQQKLGELFEEFYSQKEIVLSEIEKRRNRYLSLEYDKKIDTLEEQINLLLPCFPLLNEYNSPYEKSKLDVVLYELGHFYKTDLEKVNKDIKKAIEIFNQVGVSLTEKDFEYSYYCNKYMKEFLSQEITEEKLKKHFEEIYWKCPDIITHITLNLKYLYYKNIKEFNSYYETKVKELSNQNIIDKYKELYLERDNKIRNDAYLLQKKFLDNNLNINDYTNDKINKTYKSVIDGSPSEKINNDILKLYHSVIEYKEYLEFDYIINDIKELYKEKDKYKNIYSTKKKEIDKLEKKLLKNNKKVLKLLTKGKEEKIDVLNSQINININNLKNLYEELEKNYFLEKLSSLEDSTTIYDIFLLVSSNYNYLIELIKKNEKDETEINKLTNFINNPYNNILKNILINEEKDLNILIMDRYNLFGFNLTKEKLEKDNIESLIKDLEIILNSIAMNREGITESKIKFIKETTNLS